MRRIEESASDLGIWERGGYVPVQPFILTTAAKELLHDVGARLKELVVGHALERAGGDLHRLADITEWRDDERWFLGGSRPLSNALGAARSDVFISGGRPHIFEINIGTCLNGATSSSALSTALLRTPLGAEMVRTHGIESDVYVDQLVRWIRRQHPGESPEVALLAFPDQGDEGALRWVDEHVTRFASQGIPCEFVAVGEADIVGGSLVWRGKRYGIAIRYYMVTPRAADHLDFLSALERATGTVLFGSYVSQLFTSKNLLADLYQDDRLTAAERRVLHYVPWTARLKDGPVRRGEGRVDPVEWAALNREHAVLKPGNLFGSRGLVVGHLTSEADWPGDLEAAVQDGGYVVQERVRPDTWTIPYWHIESEALVSVDSPVLMGPFVVDGADGGVYTQQPINGTEDDFLGEDRDVSLGCVMSA
ncbi:MAG: hypothetical protein ACRDQ2_04820 [Gaiellales bacterium]